jgi:hypothetical protein
MDILVTTDWDTSPTPRSFTDVHADAAKIVPFGQFAPESAPNATTS